jgi:thermitase
MHGSHSHRGALSGLVANMNIVGMRVWGQTGGARALGCVLALSGGLAFADAARAQQPQFATDASGSYALGRVLVVPRAGLASNEVTKLASEHGGRARPIGASGVYIIDLPAQASEVAVQQRLARNPRLKAAELDRRVPVAFTPNDPYMGSAWHLPKIGAPSAWDTSQGAGVTIAVLDTGVDGMHPDLSARMVAGWNFYNNNSDTSDVHGHGTAVAGAAVASLNNGTGVASVAGQGRIMPIRISDPSAYAMWSTIAQAITWAADKGARVANISFVGLAASSSIKAAAQYMKDRGGLVLVAAGNNATQESFSPTTAMIPVSATDPNDVLTSFSSWGSFVALSAPGIDIWTTTRGGGYQPWWGTSLATPVAAGTAALVMAANKSLSGAQVENILFSTATDLGSPGRDSQFGYGRVNASAAVKAAGGSVAPADTSAPVVQIASPATGTTVSGLVAVDVSASDNVGIAKVELRANGALVATDSTSPYAFSWDSTKVANGSVSLQATALDAAGNVATSSPVAVTVSNSSGQTLVDTTPPSVSFTSPSASSALTGSSVSIKVAAADDAGTASLQLTLSIDGKTVLTGTGGSLSYKWNLRRVTSGLHTLEAVARDAAGNVSRTTIQVTK